MWLVTIVSHSLDIEHFHHYRTFLLESADLRVMIIGFTEDTGWRRVSFSGDDHGLAQWARSRQMNLNSSKHHILHGGSKIWLQMYGRMEGGSFLLKKSSIGICGVLQLTKIMSSWVELMRYKVQNKKVIVPSYVGQTTLRMQVGVSELELARMKLMK